MTSRLQEGIPWSDIDWTDNAGCIDLVERKMGVFSIIDEESRFPKGIANSKIFPCVFVMFATNIRAVLGLFPIVNRRKHMQYNERF